MEPAQTPEERASFLRSWSPEAAEAFREAAAEFGFSLDYTPESLAAVERLIREKFTKQGRKRPAKEWHDMSGATGAYVAEVVLRNLGGCWGFDLETGQGGVRLRSGAWIFPLHKSRKRYEDGPGDDFVSYYAVVADLATESKPTETS